MTAISLWATDIASSSQLLVRGSLSLDVETVACSALVCCNEPKQPSKFATNRHARSWPYLVPRVAYHDPSHSSKPCASSPQAPAMAHYPSKTKIWGNSDTAAAMVKLLRSSQDRPKRKRPAVKSIQSRPCAKA